MNERKATVDCISKTFRIDEIKNSIKEIQAWFPDVNLKRETIAK